MSKKNAIRRYEITVLRNLNVNFLSYLAYGILSQIGFRLVNAPTFVPAYLLILSGGSNLLVGLALFCQGLGQAVTPLYGANLISNRKIVGPIAIKIGFIMRINILFIGLAGLYFPNEITLIFVIFLLGLFGLAEGIARGHFQLPYVENSSCCKAG